FSSMPPSAFRPYTLSLHDALPICALCEPLQREESRGPAAVLGPLRQGHVASDDCEERSRDRGVRLPRRHHRSLAGAHQRRLRTVDRKSTRLNSSHVSISYAVFCLK